MHKREDFHHTEDQISGYIANALSLCIAAGLSDEERVALMPTLVTLLSSKQIFYEQVGPLPDLGNLKAARH